MCEFLESGLLISSSESFWITKISDYDTFYSITAQFCWEWNIKRSYNEIKTTVQQKYMHSVIQTTHFHDVPIERVG